VLSYDISGAVWQGGADGGLIIVDILEAGDCSANIAQLYLPNPPKDTTPTTSSTTGVSATVRYPVVDKTKCIFIGRASITVPPRSGNRAMLELQKSVTLDVPGTVHYNGTKFNVVVHSVGANNDAKFFVNFTVGVVIQ
jgi:hypothetical protein